MKRAIVVGADGQDGRILYERLAAEGWAVLGIGRESSRGTAPFTPGRIDVTDRACVREVVGNWQPGQIYYLAAHHHSSQEQAGSDALSLFERSHAVHMLGLLHFLDAMKDAAPAARLFYAASSLVFGEVATEVQNEQTPMNPRCIYGITKASGIHCCRFYRETHGVFASAGILYNHESIYRQEKFVSKKIIRAALEIAAGQRDKLILGDLSARIDWGYAPDFAEAMVRILALDRAEDFVIATGEAHTVREFVEIAFRLAGLDWKSYVEENPALLQRRKPVLIGDASKLRNATGWRPTVTFSEMVGLLLKPQRTAG